MVAGQNVATLHCHWAIRSRATVEHSGVADVMVVVCEDWTWEPSAYALGLRMLLKDLLCRQPGGSPIFYHCIYHPRPEWDARL